MLGFPNPGWPVRFARTRSSRGGFTVLELVMVLVIMAVLATLVVRMVSVPPVQAVRDATETFSSALRQARADALNQEADGVLLVDEGSADGAGRFRAIVLASNADTVSGTAMDSTRWTNLDYGVRFGTGAAQGRLGPMGDSVIAAVPTRRVRCPVGNRCRFGADSTVGWVTFYFSHEDRPEVVQAVVVTAQGSPHLYRFRNGGWQ